MKKLLAISLLFVLSVSGWTQQVVNYQQSSEIITNPERGFYAHHQSMNGMTLLNPETLVRNREEKGISLILMLYYLPEFMEGPISQEALANMESNFNIMREAGVKCILRFAYRSSQNSRPYDPTVEIVQEHIRNITPVIRSGSDVILTIQAGFVGVWGEWYYTTHFGFPTPDFDKRNLVVDGLLNALPERRSIQLRTPKLKFGICDIDETNYLTADQAFSGSKIARIGHHNDCFLASSTDYGTYGNIAIEKAYLELDTRYLIMGGETCNPSSFSECENALAEMERFHWTYLNSGYHGTVLNNWATEGCMAEIKKRLGYRLYLMQGRYTGEARPGGCFSINLKLGNAGFAAPFNPRDVELLLIQTDGEAKYWVRLPDNPQFWLPGEIIEINHAVTLPAGIPEGTYRLYLNLPDPEPELFDRPEYSIQLANTGTWESETGYNNLLHTLQVSEAHAGDACDTNLSFQPFPRIPHLDIVSSDYAWNISDHAKIFPNPLPSGGRINLEFNTDFADQAVMRIMSISGQLIMEEAVELKAGHNAIQLAESSGLPRGLYYLSVTGEKSYLQKKLTIH